MKYAISFAMQGMYYLEAESNDEALDKFEQLPHEELLKYVYSADIADSNEDYDDLYEQMLYYKQFNCSDGEQISF